MSVVLSLNPAKSFSKLHSGPSRHWQSLLMRSPKLNGCFQVRIEVSCEYKLSRASMPDCSQWHCPSSLRVLNSQAPNVIIKKKDKRFSLLIHYSADFGVQKSVIPIILSMNANNKLGIINCEVNKLETYMQ